MQPLATRHQQLQSRCSRQQVGQQRCGVEEVLEVVEQQQQALVAQELLQLGDKRLAAGFPYPQCLGHGADDESGIANRHQVDEVHAIDEVFDQIGRHLHAQAGLANATGASERHQVRVRPAQQLTQRGTFLFAPDQRRGLRRQGGAHAGGRRARLQTDRRNRQARRIGTRRIAGQADEGGAILQCDLQRAGQRLGQRP